MKKIIVLCILCWHVALTEAQQYYPLVDSGAVWNQTSWHIIGPSQYDYSGSKLFFKGDTVVNDTFWQKMWIQPTYHYTSSFGIITYQNLSDDASLVGWLHEDSDKKVWYRDFASGFTFLLFDFDLSPGDTLYWTALHPVVDSVVNVQMLNGEWRKQYNVTGNLGTESFIEGIGSTLGPFDVYSAHFNGSSFLTCYRSNDVELYTDSSESSMFNKNCDYIFGYNGIADPLQNPTIFEVSPNPATDFLSINFSSPDFASADLRIIDAIGHILFDNRIARNETTKIPLDPLSNGLVFCELWQNDRLISIRKIAIQK